jgi:membrane protease YdiL (CAAX protease family)
MMNYSPMTAPNTPKSLIERLQALFEVLLLSGLISSFLAALLLSAFHGKSAQLLSNDAKFVTAFLLLEAGITIFLLLVVLRAHRETLRSLGLAWENWKSHLLTGLILVPFLFLINAIVSFVFRVYLPKYFIEQNPLTELIHTPRQLGLFIISALVAGGLKEELQRAFILNRFSRYLGGAGLGLVLWSLAFGAGHYVQGMQGIATAAIYGFIFGLTYLMSGSLIAPIVAHGTYDTLALLLYWFFSGRSR